MSNAFFPIAKKVPVSVFSLKRLFKKTLLKRVLKLPKNNNSLTINTNLTKYLARYLTKHLTRYLIVNMIGLNFGGV